MPLPPIGLVNLGNTCYLNSSIQSLLPCLPTSMQPFNQPTKWEHVVLNELINLNQNKGNPKRLIYALQNITSNFIFTDQNDVGEFLFLLLDNLHVATCAPINIKIHGVIRTLADKYNYLSCKLLQTSYKQSHSFINDLFYGVQFTQIIDPATKKVIRKQPELFSITTLYPTPKTGSLTQCIKAYCALELLQGDNAWFNEATGLKQAVYRRIVYWQLPPVLIFYINRNTNNGSKNRQHIDFPLELDMTPFMALATSPGNKKYVLQSVCNHHGHSTRSGHYTAFVWDGNNNATWWHCNDMMVSPMAVSHVVTPGASCLFYRRI